MGEGVVGSEGGDKEMVGNEGGGTEWMLTGNTKQQQQSSLLCLVSLCRVLTVSLTVTCTHSPVKPWGCGHACCCCSCTLAVRQPLLAVVIVVRQLMLLVGRWLSFAARGHLCVWRLIGQWTYFGQPVLFEVVGIV